MIYNKSNTPAIAIDELRADIPMLDKKTEFELLIPDIENAVYDLEKIVGHEVYQRAEAEYLADSSEKPSPTGLYRHVQSVIANMAFRDYTINNDLRHSTTGRKAAVNSANEKQAWEFFIERDNEGLNFRIQKALNRLIDHLDRTRISEWVSSKTFKIRSGVLLPDIDSFCRYYPIDNSLALFNQLLPFQLEMQRKHIAPILGSELMAQMLAVCVPVHNPDPDPDMDLEDYSSGSGSDALLEAPAEPDATLVTLIDYACPALALWTMATGINRLSLKLLPEGLVQQFKSSVQSRQSSFPVLSKTKDLVVASLIRDAQQATDMLENQLKIIQAAETTTTIAAVSTLVDRNASTNKYFSM
jgi:hypothetical protein